MRVLLSPLIPKLEMAPSHAKDRDRAAPGRGSAGTAFPSIRCICRGSFVH